MFNNRAPQMGNSSSSKYTIDLSTVDDTHPSTGRLTAIKPGTDLEKIVVLGASEAGKTCLITQHVANHFVPTYEVTVEDSFRKIREVDGVAVTYEILDTSGSEEFTAMLDQYMRVGRGFLIVYSVCDRKSFDKCSEIHKNILRAKDADRAPMVLVGTKSDLESDRVVPTSHGEELAKQLGIPFLETSAKNRINVDEVFDDILRQIARFGTVLAHAGGGKK